MANNQFVETNIYTVFEREFGRLLSPFEIEQISSWIDEGYEEAIIKAALTEAVYMNKRNFRYIDKILWNWQQNHIRTVEDAKEFSRKFRREITMNKPTNLTQQNETKAKKPIEFEFYNWLEEE